MMMKSRAAIALGRVSFRLSFLFMVFALLEYPALHSGTFGITPIIPTVFLVCVDVIALLVSIALALAATLASFKPLFFSWRAMCGCIFTTIAGVASFIACSSILSAG
jgi:site-specific recombinase